MDIHSEIRRLEKEIENAKYEFQMGRASLKFSKRKVLRLEKQLAALARQLPEHEQQLHAIKKEFGKGI